MPACSVPYCVNASGKETRCTFHPFPHETPIFLKKWLENIGRPNWRPGLRSVVCCEHFEKDDFDRQGRLRIGSFPVKFPEPPFRKKMKIEEKAVGSASALLTTHNNQVLIPVVKKLPTIIPRIPANQNEPSERVSSVENASSPLKVGLQNKNLSSVENTSSAVKVASQIKTVTVPPKNGSNENNIKMKLDQNTSSVNKMPEVPSKRKVLEESQPTAFKPGLVSSYSLRACRICGATHNTNVDIFGHEGKRLSLADLLKKCHIQVSDSDCLPHYVCRQCIPRLKTTHELLTTWEKTSRSLNSKDKKNTEEPDPPVIHSKPLQPQHASRGNRRVLLLEMCLRDGIPVKDMITQAIQELTLRLKPKESRETKPEGRIMFLDLQGGTDAFPEQMKKAISMLFPSVEKRPTPANQKVPIDKTPIPPATVPTVSGISSPTTNRQGMQATKGSGSSLSPGKQTINVKSPARSASTKSVPGSSKQAFVSKTTTPSTGTSTPTVVKQPVQVKATGQSFFIPSTETTTVPALRPFTIQALGPDGVTQNIVIQAPPEFPSVPVTFMSSTPGASPALKFSAIPTLPTGGMPQLIPVSSMNYLINQQSNPTTSDKAKDTSADSDDDIHIYEDSPSMCESSIQSGNDDVPPLVPIKQLPVSKEKPNEARKVPPAINISKMRDSVVSKLSSMPNQIKLGDKIVGIVLRKSDSKDDIRKKLQETFAPNSSSSKDNKVKERPILPKGSICIPGVESMSPSEVEGGKKLKPKVLDVPSAVDSPTDYSDRRNARKLSLSYMWRKTGFLVSSYQKLFTWNIGSDERAVPLLTCRVCNFVPKSRQEVENHLGSHPDLQCPICSKYFLKDTKVFEHMSVIHGTVNPAAYASKKKQVISWRLNTVKRPSLRQYQCSRCDRRFKLKDSLKRHVSVCKERSPTERVMNAADVCAVCSRSFTTEEALQEHMLTHVKRTSWLCDICGLVLKSASNYRGHVARHDEFAHEFKYQCNTCKKRFKLKNRFEDHVKKHEIQQQYICSSCGKSFHSINGLRQHEILHGERKLQCKFCPSRFHRRDHLRIHESSHTKSKAASSTDGRSGPVTARTFTCRFCVKDKNTVVRFPNMRELMKHYTDDHAYVRGAIPAAKKFDCDRCNKSFVNSTLLRHHHMWHAGLRPYTCSVCGAGFMVKERMRNHEMTHTNERPYLCHVCGKGFRSRHVLKQHRVIHKDPSEFFKCQYCDKSFSRIDNLRTHTRVHTGEKPWKCIHCSRQFRLRSDCTKHIQIAHQVPPEEVGASIETLMDPLTAVSEAQSAIAAIAGITTVQDMELLIEDDDIEECDEDSLE